MLAGSVFQSADRAPGVSVACLAEDDEAVYEAIRSLLDSAGFRSVHYPSAEALLRETGRSCSLRRGGGLSNP